MKKYDKSTSVYNYRSALERSLSADVGGFTDEIAELAEDAETRFMDEMYAAGFDIEDGRVYECDNEYTPDFGFILESCIIHAMIAAMKER